MGWMSRIANRGGNVLGGIGRSIGDVGRIMPGMRGLPAGQLMQMGRGAPGAPGQSLLMGMGTPMAGAALKDRFGNTMGNAQGFMPMSLRKRFAGLMANMRPMGWRGGQE